MVSRPIRVKRPRRLAIEVLEDRAVPATFGVPWSDPSHLTLSFVPDGTPIAGHTSSLFQTLERSEPTAVWEREILRAFQTWAVNANINIGAGGRRRPGPGRRRRLAARPAVRRHPRRRPADGRRRPLDLGPQRPGGLEHPDGRRPDQHRRRLRRKLDLVSVLLHEAGHVFGIGDGTDPNSPMYSQYTGNTKLTSADVAALQALYGTRAPDPHEGSGGNDTIATATTIQPPGGWTGATPLVAYGDVSHEQGRRRLRRPPAERLPRPDHDPAPVGRDQPAAPRT